MKFNNWVWPDDEALALEWKVEWEKKGLDRLYPGVSFPTSNDFIAAIKKHSSEKSFTASEFGKIDYTAILPDKESILSLISTYQSYPKYRNEKTLDAIFQGFETNKPMKMPIVIKYRNRYRILSGNTRSNVAILNDIPVKCIVFDIDALMRDMLTEKLTNRIMDMLIKEIA
jgi:DNA polymerase elongation subunit (family B)